MTDFYQGDIIKIAGFAEKYFVITSKNAFIRATNVFHVCPLLQDISAGPVHISVKGTDGTIGVAICEQLKVIDPSVRACSRVDRLPYADIMEVSDTIQGIFEYD